VSEQPPSDEATEARQQAEAARDDARADAERAARKMAEAIRAIGRLRDHSRADSFVAMVQRALEER
jgi:uncharacterized membrane protein YqiK